MNNKFVKFKDKIDFKKFPYILEDYQKILSSQEYFKVLSKNNKYIQVETKFGIKLFDITDVKEYKKEIEKKVKLYKVNNNIDLEDFPYVNSPEEYKKLIGKIGKFDKFINKEIIQLEFKDEYNKLLLFIFNIWDVEEL